MHRAMMQRLLFTMAAVLLLADQKNAGIRYAVNHLTAEQAKGAEIVIVNCYPKGSEYYDGMGWGSRGLKDGAGSCASTSSPMA
jgi:hypothetical protein